MKFFLKAEALVSFVALGLTLVLLATLSISREVPEEWDAALQFASGTHFWATGAYTGWASHFWPPLQPLILAAGDPFLIGRSVSFAAFLLILASVFTFARMRGLTFGTAALTTATLGSFAPYWVMALQVENHALETSFVLAGFVLLAGFKIRPSLGLLLLCAVAFAIASLARYTAYAAALAAAITLLVTQKDALRSTVIFSTAFAGLNMPWWVLNFVQNGSPLHTWQYMNIGARLNPGGPNDWWWHAQEQFAGLGEVIRTYPAAFAGNWLSNVGLGLVQIATSQGSDWVLALVFWAIPMLAIFSKTRRAAPQDISQDLGTCAAIGVAFLGLASMALVFPEALLPVSAILGTVTIVFSLKALPATRVLLAILLVPNLLLSYQTGREYVAREGTDGGQLVAFEETSNTLQTLGATSASRITSVHPARALKAGTRWLAAPAAGYSEFCGFLAYDYGSRIDAYVPRIPVSDTLALPNFVVVDPFLRGLLSRNDVTLKDSGTCPDLHLSWSTTPVTPEVDIIVLQPER